MQKFQLGDDVVVEMMGKIKGVDTAIDGSIRYVVESDPGTGGYVRAYVKESQVFPLPVPTGGSNG